MIVIMCMMYTNFYFVFLDSTIVNMIMVYAYYYFAWYCRAPTGLKYFHYSIFRERSPV